MTQAPSKARAAVESIGELRSQSQRLDLRIQELEARCGKLTATYGIRTRGNGTCAEDLWVLLCEEKTRLQRQMLRLAKAQRLVEQQVDKVPSELGRLVLRYHGLDRLDWNDTAERIGHHTGHLYSCSRLRAVYREAMEELDRLWPR